MTYLWFALVLLLAAGIVIVLRLFGIRVNSRRRLKVLAVSLAMLPMLVMSALYLSLLAFGAALAVLMGRL